MRFIITLVLLVWLTGCTATDTPPENRYALIEGTGRNRDNRKTRR